MHTVNDQRSVCSNVAPFSPFQTTLHELENRGSRTGSAADGTTIPSLHEPKITTCGMQHNAAHTYTDPGVN